MDMDTPQSAVLNKAEIKEAFKEAAKEFLAEKWTQTTSTFGKWMLGVIAAAALAGLFWIVMISQGWKSPQ
jgi:hypothetical protein